MSMVDSENEEVRWAYGQRERANRSIAYSEIQCYRYNIQMNRAPVTGDIRLAKWFIEEV
jgi:hypothetical protein